MDIVAYLDRIDYRERPGVDVETLCRLHRAHLLAIPYENLDIHLGRPLALDEQRIFEKLVVERRGGWCYEMNALLAWALRELGFEVRLLSGSVNRPVLGDRAEGNHLVLLVALERPYLVDAGFGNGFLEPLPLAPGTYQQDFLAYQLDEHDGRWHFANHAYGGPGFDFTLEPHALTDFAGQCHALQTSPDSGFVRLTVCHRHTPEGIVSLRGAVLTTITGAGVATHTITSVKEYLRTLDTHFGLDLPEAARLWPRIWEGHVAWAQEQH